ncbi:hypothetical protein [Streptomyces sp. KL116D]|uniref:hypothetical protein n=1 Tax=Streptomyces sp. KL116D TaxID=3045152 RepID=UPI0035578A2E
MTPALRTARTCTTAALTLTAGGIYLAITLAWWAVLPALYVAAFLAWVAAREYGYHRLILAEHERARRAARLEVRVFTPCCRLHEISYGYAHGRDCRRPPDPTRPRSLPPRAARTAS